MLDSASKAFFQLLARSRILKILATKYAMRGRQGLVHRFVPGESIDDAIRAALSLPIGLVAVRQRKHRQLGGDDVAALQLNSALH